MPLIGELAAAALVGSRPVAPTLDSDGAATAEEYGEMTRQLLSFLEGDTDEVRDHLEAEMQRSAEDLEYERAARFEHPRIARFVGCS